MKCSKCGAESVEGDKFCVACGTPLVVPSIPKITQSEASLGQSPDGSTTPGHTKLLKLTCPSCGGALELPDNLTVAHCLYCGTKILLDQDGVVRERRDLQRYIELCKVAIQALNHTEVNEYCNRILEIDPKDIEAWLDKATSTFYLQTPAHNRYQEVMAYLDKASQIAPDDTRVINAREWFKEGQALWLNRLGLREEETARCIPYSNDSSGNVISAMGYFLAASDLVPLNIAILENIERLAKDTPWIQWGENVHAKMRTLELFRAKKDDH